MRSLPWRLSFLLAGCLTPMLSAGEDKVKEIVAVGKGIVLLAGDVGLSDQGVAVVQVDPDRMAALEAKAIDAGMLQRVATKVMVGKGYYPLLNMVQSKIPCLYTPFGQSTCAL